jgi:hypothetical protein
MCVSCVALPIEILGVEELSRGSYWVGFAIS